jgi:hypothetical protein
MSITKQTYQATTQSVMLRQDSHWHVASAEGINCVEKIAEYM